MSRARNAAPIQSGGSQLNKQTSRTDVPDISGQYGGSPFDFQLPSKFPAMELAALGSGGYWSKG